MSDEKRRIILYLIAGLSTFAFAPIIVKWAGESNPIALATWRTFIAFIILLPIWVKKHLTTNTLRQNLKEDIHLKILSGFALGLHFTLWISSLSYTSVASASVLVAVHPVILILAESLLFKVRFNFFVWIGVMISFTGSVLLGWLDHVNETNLYEQAWLGNVLAFSAAVVFVVYFLISRKLRQKTDWLDYVFNIYQYAAVTCIIGALLLGTNLMPTPLLLFCALALAIGPQIIGHGSMNYAVKYVSATVLSTLVLSEPILATLLAILFFDEYPTLEIVMTMLVVLMGVMLTWKKSRKTQAPMPEG